MASERFQAGLLLVSAWASIDHKREWSMSNHHFALAVDRLRELNSVACMFWTVNGAAGRRSQDFDETLTLMMSADLVDYVAPAYTHLMVKVRPHVAKRLMARADLDEAKLAQAIELASLHWALATQQV